MKNNQNQITRDLLNQIKFISELANRLKDDTIDNLKVPDDNKYNFARIQNKTQIINDSIRLRRELNKFNKLLEDEFHPII